MQVLSTESAKIIFGAAVFDDILGMILLAMVGGLASPKGSFGWLQLTVLTAEAAAFAIFMIFVAPRIVRRVQPRLEKLSTHNAPLVASLLLCLFLSWLSVKIGMAAIIGAFFAGMMFADYAPGWNLLLKTRSITEFLSPYFFFAIGTRLNLHLFTRNLVLDATVITALAIVSKVLACGFPMRHRGWREMLQVGVGMMPHGEVALIVALVGLQSQIVTQSTYAIVVFMTAATTILAPPLLRFLFSKRVSNPG